MIAKLFGIDVLEFGIGLPPKALTLFKRKETEYSLNWLPIGGFVRLAGEDPTSFQLIGASLGAGKHMFFAKPAWQRALVIVAGVVMNFLIGILMFSIVYAKIGIPQLGGEQVLVTQVAKGSPAELAGIKPGAVLVRVGDDKIESSAQFIEIVKGRKGELIRLYLAQMDSSGVVEDSLKVVEVIPRENPPAGEGSLGVGISTVPIVSYQKKSWYLAPFYGASEGIKEALAWGGEFVRILAHPKELLGNLSGPVAVVKVGQQAASEGWVTMMRFGGIISLNLAIFNLLPIPALDGGRLLMIGLEKIIGRKRVVKFERYANAAGMILLIMLLIGITVKDVFFS